MKRRGCGLEQTRPAPTLRNQAYRAIAERRRVAVQHLAALGGQVHANCTLCQEGIRERVRAEQLARRGPAQDPEDSAGSTGTGSTDSADSVDSADFADSTDSGDSADSTGSTDSGDFR